MRTGEALCGFADDDMVADVGDSGGGGDGDRGWAADAENKGSEGNGVCAGRPPFELGVSDAWGRFLVRSRVRPGEASCGISASDAVVVVGDGGGDGDTG